MRKIDSQLQDRLETLITAMGFELVGCEIVPQGNQASFRIYIDTAKGVSVDDCSLVSRQVGAMLDVVDSPFQDRYRLEVSSPGIDRPLFKLEHFARVIGQEVKVKMHLPVNDRRQFKGLLQRVEEEDIYILVDGIEGEVKLPFSAIDRANLVGNIRI